MTGANPNGYKAAEEATAQRRKMRGVSWPLVIVAALLVIVPFLYWYGTWFGRELDDRQIDEYLREDAKPRHVQHALQQIAAKIEKGSADAELWHPRVIEAAKSAHPDVRMTAAWVMGLEHERGDYREALLLLIEDPEPIVRRNAALALVRFGDARSRPTLLSMLRPHAINSPANGALLATLSVGAKVNRETMLTRIRKDEGSVLEVRAPLPGEIARVNRTEGESVREGEELFALSPDDESVRAALIGLSYFGEAEDLAEIERYAQGVEGMSEEVKKQAALTVEAVRRRSSGKI